MTELAPIDLAGFAPPFGCSEYAWGPSVNHEDAHWKDHAYHVEVLGWFYHDYLGTHLFVQVWDYTQQDHPDQRWQFMLLLHRPSRLTNTDDQIVKSEWAWTIRKEYPHHDDMRPPSYAEVGADVDLWLEAPEILRFIIE